MTLKLTHNHTNCTNTLVIPLLVDLTMSVYTGEYTNGSGVTRESPARLSQLSGAIVIAMIQQLFEGVYVRVCVVHRATTVVSQLLALIA